MKKIFLFLLIFLSMAMAKAQESAISQWSLQSAHLQTLDYVETYKEEKVFHIPAGQIVTATVLINLEQRELGEEEEAEAAPSSCFYMIDNIVHAGTITEISDGSFELLFTLPNNAGVYPISVGLKEDEMINLEESVTIWGLPIITTDPIQPVYEGEEVSLTTRPQGAINGQWSFRWYAQDQEIESNKDKSSYSFNAPGVLSKTTFQYTLFWEYGYGDKKWFNGNLTFMLDTYPIPEYDFNIHVNGIAQIVPTLLPTDEVSMNVHISKGNSSESTYKYEWKERGTVVGHNSSYSYTAENNTSTSLLKKYEVIVTNQIPGGKTRSSNVMFYEFNVQPSPFVTNKVQMERVVFNPESSITLEVQPSEGIQNVEWVYVWKKSGNNLDINSNKNDIPKEDLHNDSETETLSHVYELNVSCKGKTGGYNEGKIYPLAINTFIYKIDVLPDPKLVSISLPASSTEDSKGLTSSNRPITYTVSHQGGDVNGWKYEVIGDATLLKVDGDDLTISFKNNTLAKAEKKFSVVVTNSITSKGSETQIFKQDLETIVYPTPSIEWTSTNLENYFYGSKVQWSTGVVGENPGTWTYRWTLDGEEITMPYTIPESYSDSYKHEVKVVGTNTCKGEIWGTSSVTHNFTAWRPGQLTNLVLDYVDGTNIYEDTSFGLLAEVSGGYEKGWSFKWTRIEDNSSIEGQEIRLAANRLTNGGYELQNYMLTVENDIPGLNEKYSESRTQQVTIWRKAESIPSDFTITNQNNGQNVEFGIREGNTIVLNTMAAQYGYKGNWQYLWNDVASNNNYQIAVPSFVEVHNQKSTQDKQISLKVSNFGPNGTAWENKEINKTVTIYRKPQTPKSLVKKGNGSSRTLIATMELSDNDLQANEYYLVFGYRNGDGSITQLGEPQRQMNPGNTRWSTQIQPTYFNDENNLCVYALWKYGDGTLITSGLRFYDGTEDANWDGSDFSSTTRGGDDVTTDINEIRSDYISDNVKESYTIMGIRSNQMVKGLNIIKQKDGTTRKIIIK